MDFFLISKLGNDLSIIQNLQRLMISILSSDSQVVISELVTELFNSFTKLEISKHYSLYEIILRIFVHLSICYNFCETKDEEVISRRHEIYCMILKELISKHSLKSSFHQFTLFNIFKSNKHLLLFLVQEEIVSISFLITRFSRMSSQFLSQFSPQFTLNLFLFFIPEIKRYDRIFYEQLKEQMNLNEEDIRLAYHISNENFQDSTIEENLIEIRRKIHSEDEIAKIIRSDDLDHFIDFCSTISDFDLNSQIKSSFLEDNPDINNDEKGGISLIEYSMAFGSINIFRYLLLKDAKITIKSYSYCIIGNNYEIVHLLEEEPRLQMDDEDEMNMFEKNPFVGFGEEELDDETYNMLVDQQYSRFHEVVFHKSIEYYHPEFIEYYSPELAPLSILTIITTFNETSNIEILCELFPGNKEFTQCSEIEGSYKIAPCDITTTLFLPTVFFTIMNFEQTPIYFLYCFFFQLANININMTDDKGETPLFAACRMNHYDIVELLLKQPNININSKNNNGETPLQIACRFNHYEIVKLLLKQSNIDLNSKDKFRKTPLYTACSFHHYEVVELLLKQPNIDINSQNYHGETPLFSVCYNDICYEIVELLLKQPNIDINLKKDNGETPLYHACCNDDSYKITELLLKQPNIDINLKKDNDETPLFAACRLNHYNIVDLLLEQPKIDMNSKNNKGICDRFLRNTTSCSVLLWLL